jgi:hypothetical protein
MSDLDARLMNAHETGDKPELVTLYTEAACQTDDDNARAFFLTHAYVFALEINHPDVANIKSQLKAMNRI